MGYFVFAFIAGGITAALAAGKKRNGAGWFFIGFLLPLIGFILILVLPDGEDILAEPSLKPNEAVPPNVGVAVAPRELTPTQEIEKLASLHASGALSDAEFQDKKQVFLDRIV